MKITKLKPGMKVHDVGRYKMGNTTMSTVAVWPVYIVSVDEEAGVVVARWNGNQERRYYQNTWSKWRENKPLLISGGMGNQRLATREEIAAHKAANAALTGARPQEENETDGS